MPDRVFTSADAARIARVTLRQLQWWDERKLISPRRRDHRRVYLPIEVIEIMVVAELRGKGFSLQKIRRILRLLRRDLGRRLRKSLRSKSPLYLVTGGKSVHFENASEQVVNLLKKARRPMSLVCLSDLAAQLAHEKVSAHSDRQLALF